MKRNFDWTIHNMIAHPISEIVYLLGFDKLSNWIHDVTVPKHKSGTGRG
jgi:hypothetical protein